MTDFLLIEKLVLAESDAIKLLRELNKRGWLWPHGFIACWSKENKFYDLVAERVDFSPSERVSYENLSPPTTTKIVEIFLKVNKPLPQHTETVGRAVRQLIGRLDLTKINPPEYFSIMKSDWKYHFDKILVKDFTPE